MENNNNDLMETMTRYFNELIPEKQKEFLKGLINKENKKNPTKAPEAPEAPEGR